MVWNAYIDDQNCVFNGKHVDKKRVKFKRGGDVYMYDELCADGWTYAVHHNNMSAPKD